MSGVDLLALAERVEASAGADRGLDAEIAASNQRARVVAAGHAGSSIIPNLLSPGSVTDSASTWQAPCYTASLDAAMTLVPEFALFMTRTVWDGDKTAGIATISQYEDRKEGDQLRRYWLREHEACAATPALALVSAALRARHQSAAGEGENG